LLLALNALELPLGRDSEEVRPEMIREPMHAVELSAFGTSVAGSFSSPLAMGWDKRCACDRSSIEGAHRSAIESLRENRINPARTRLSH